MRKCEPMTVGPERPAGPRWWTLTGALSMVLGAASAVAATATISANVTVAVPLTVSSDEPLRFGSLGCDDDDDDDDEDDCGTVTIHSDHTHGDPRHKTGDVKLKAKKNAGRAKFIISGTPGTFYTIILPSSVDILREGDAPVPGVTLLQAINPTSFSTTAGGSPLPGEIGPDGTDTLWVGATLVVPATVKEGKFQGGVPLTVAFP